MELTSHHDSPCVLDVQELILALLGFSLALGSFFSFPYLSLLEWGYTCAILCGKCLTSFFIFIGTHTAKNVS